MEREETADRFYKRMMWLSFAIAALSLVWWLAEMWSVWNG